MPPANPQPFAMHHSTAGSASRGHYTGHLLSKFGSGQTRHGSGDPSAFDAHGHKFGPRHRRTGGSRSVEVATSISRFFKRLQQEFSLQPANLIYAFSHIHSARLLVGADDALPGSGLQRTWMKELFESTVCTM
jgi:hypothetical protein